jgi:putative transposase
MDIFRESTDFEVLLGFLRRAAERHLVALHAYALMTNHLHLIATPARPTSLPKMMQELGVHYVRFFNRKYARTGTLWNSRYRGLHLRDEKYWLTCLRYVEQNPVRAGLAADPAGYRWSSYSAHAFGNWPNWLVPHYLYKALGRADEERQRAYQALCLTPLTSDQLAISRQPVQGVGGVSDTPPTPLRYNVATP